MSNKKYEFLKFLIFFYKNLYYQRDLQKFMNFPVFCPERFFHNFGKKSKGDSFSNFKCFFCFKK